MTYTSDYSSPLGLLALRSDGSSLTGLWFIGQKHFPPRLPPPDKVSARLPLFREVRKWLDCYFQGKVPELMPAIRLEGTPFRMKVWETLRQIPYGETVTYKDIAQELAQKAQTSALSAQAVGGAVGHNPVSILVPCHRVIGSDGSLKGYAAGLDKKRWLLEMEQKKGK